MYSGHSTTVLTLRAKGSFSYAHLSLFNERADCCNHSSAELSIYALPVHPKFLYGYCLRQSALIHWSPSRSFLSGGARYCRLPPHDRPPRGCRASRRARDPDGSYQEMIGLLADIEGCYPEKIPVRRAGERPESGHSGWSSNGEIRIKSADEERWQSSRREDVRMGRRGGSSSSCYSATSSSLSGDSEPNRDRHRRVAGERLNGYEVNRVDAFEREVREVQKYEDSARSERGYASFADVGNGCSNSTRASSPRKASEWEVRGREEKNGSLMDRAREATEGYARAGQRRVGQRDSREGPRKLMMTSVVHEDDTKRASILKNVVGARESSSASAVTRHSEIDQRGVGSTESRSSSQKLKEISDIHGSNTQRASERHFEETRLRDRVDTSTSVQNSVVARDEMIQMEQQAVDKVESNQQYKNRTDVSRIRASVTQKKNISHILVETRRDDQEHHSTSAVNLVCGASRQQSQINERVNQQYSSRRASERDTKLSELSRSEIERVSNSQEMSNSRIEREDHSTSVVNLFHGTTEQQNQTNNRVDRQYSSRKATERDTGLSEFSSSKIERVSDSQGISITGIDNQKDNSSSLLVRDKKDKQRSTLVGESSQSKKTQVASSGISDNSSSSLHTDVHALDRQTSGDEIYQFKDNRLESASRLDMSSAMYVGEFVNKLQQEVSTSDELDNASKHSSEIQMEEVHRGTSQTATELCSSVLDAATSYKDEKYIEESARQSSSRTGMKGPSDEMWDVKGPYSEEPSRTEEPEEDPSTVGVADSTTAPARTGNSITRRSHRSLWTYIADIIRAGWGLRAESQNSTLKSGTRSSSNESVSSEAWFSGHELDENDDETARKGSGGTPKESVQVKRPVDPSHLRTNSAPSQESSEASGPGNRITLSEASSSTSMGSTRRGSLSKGAFPVYKPEDLQWTEGEKGRLGGPSSAVIIEQSSSLTTGTGSPTIEDEITEVGNGQTSGSGFPKLEAERELAREKTPEVGGIEGKDEELKRRKLQRNKQVLKERFDEWEEAYKRESEQRKIDEFFMREALLEAKKAADTWEVPVGAVLVQNGKIIARGCNLVEELRDSTAHAEMICIREASSLLRTWRLAGTALYVTLEPCAMCAGAILQARIDTVVWGAPNKLLGADGSWVRLFPGGDGGSNSLDPSSQTAGPVHPFHPKITVRRGILTTECSDVMQQFFQLRRKKKKPEPPPPSCLPISTHPTKLFTKMHDVFSMMFCL